MGSKFCVKIWRHLALPQRRSFAELAVEVRHVRARRRDFLTREPSPYLAEPDQAATADFQRWQFAPCDYSVDSPAADPQAFRKLTYPDKCTFNIRLHVLTSFLKSPSLLRCEFLKKSMR